MQLKLSEKMQIMSDRAKDADIRSTLQERELKQSLGRVDSKIMKIEGSNSLLLTKIDKMAKGLENLSKNPSENVNDETSQTKLVADNEIVSGKNQEQTD